MISSDSFPPFIQSGAANWFEFLCLVGVLPPLLSVLLWVAVVISTSMLFILPRRGGILAFLITVILRSVYTLGLAPTLLLLGATNVRLESIHLAAERVYTKLASEWTAALRNMQHFSTFTLAAMFVYSVVPDPDLLRHGFKH